MAARVGETIHDTIPGAWRGVRLSEALEDWRKRLHDAEEAGYLVRADVLIRNFLKTLSWLGDDAEAVSDGMLKPSVVAGLYAVHPKTVAKRARAGHWPGARRTNGESGHWRIPAVAVYADLARKSPKPETPHVAQAVVPEGQDQEPKRNGQLAGVSRRLPRRGGRSVGVATHRRLG